MHDWEGRFGPVFPPVQWSSVSRAFCSQEREEQKQGLREQVPEEIRIGIAGDYMQFIFEAAASTSCLSLYTSSTGHHLSEEEA